MGPAADGTWHVGLTATLLGWAGMKSWQNVTWFTAALLGCPAGIHRKGGQPGPAADGTWHVGCAATLLVCAVNVRSLALCVS